MSKLDDIFKELAHTIAVGVLTDDWEKVDTKQQIKDLMLETYTEAVKAWATANGSDLDETFEQKVNKL